MDGKSGRSTTAVLRRRFTRCISSILGRGGRGRERRAGSCRCSGGRRGQIIAKCRDLATEGGGRKVHGGRGKGGFPAGGSFDVGWGDM